MSDKHSRHSTLRERIVEHRFVADALQHLWKRDIFDVEVLRPEFDAWLRPVDDTGQRRSAHSAHDREGQTTRQGPRWSFPDDKSERMPDLDRGRR